ncbi:MAG: hypothetical protein IT293_02540 [Deltaproteobacteria bacterium]|nr:hypothetical protein [Deltaproteobacteria bacterium]
MDAIVLPDGWAARLVVVDNANTNDFRGLCLEPGDLAVSKLAAARPKDIAFVRVLLREGIISRETLGDRLAATAAIEPSRAAHLLDLIADSPYRSSP